VAQVRNSRNPYSHEERIAAVTQVDRLVRIGGLSLQAAANAAGVSPASYSNWRRAGIEPERPSLRTDEERADLVQAVSDLMEAGATAADACNRVGITETSYRKWRAKLRPQTMRPVEIKALVPVAPAALALAPPLLAPGPPEEPKPAQAALVLTAPGGYRLEGLDPASAAAVLKALA
jgi:transposase-like protein